MMRLSSSVSYEKAVEVSRDFKMLPDMSRAGLERLTQPYASACQAQTRELLDTAKDAALLAGRGRKVVIEVDGVRVLEKAQDGVCGGIEIKSAVIHPVSAPQQRTLLADVCEATAFTDQVAGLMREAGLRQDDEVIGLSDGAQWIKHLYETLGVKNIIDVYHTAVPTSVPSMLGLGWDEPRRATTRAEWLRGEIDAAACCVSIYTSGMCQ